MAEVIVHVEDAAVQALLNHLRNKLTPMGLIEWMHTRAHVILRERASTRFSGEGDDAVSPWIDLAFATGRIRAAQGYSPYHPINVRSGALRNFILNSFTVRPSASGAVMMMPGNASGVLLSKLRVAQQGGKRVETQVSRPGLTGRSNATLGVRTARVRPAPPRPVVGLSTVDMTLLGHDLMDWIQMGMPV